MPDLQRLGPNSDVDSVTAAILADGGAIIENFLSPETLEGLRRDLYPLLDRTQGGADDAFDGTRTRRISALFARTRHMAEIALHPLYIGPAENILRKPVESWVGERRVSTTPDIRIGVTQAIQIGPGQGAQPLHRDDGAFLWRHPDYGREARLQVMVAITDFTRENGATLVIPGSHRWDDHRKPEISETIPAVMSAGSALLFVGSTFHAGGCNVTTDQYRTGLTMTFDLANVRQEENMYLALPKEVVRSYPERIQRLLGWTSGTNHMGWVEIDGRMADPIVLLRDGVGGAA